MLKLLTSVHLLLMPVLAMAQNVPGMSEADLQKMEACMKNVDEAKLEELEQRSSKIEAEVKSLCASGKRAEAQAKAMAFAQEMAKNPTLQAMSKCGEMMKGMMPKVPFTDQGKGGAGQHVCD